MIRARRKCRSGVWPRHSRRDRGGVAVIVAVLLGSGVLLGMAALVLDVGLLYAERTQLRSGADAAALKVAQVCASPTGCAASDTTADDYASLNANDGAAAATVCGRGGDYPSTCPPPSTALPDCIGAPPAAPTGFAEVRTTTLEPDGSTLLPPIFAQAVLGGGFAGAEVAACARAAWGPPSAANTLAMTISACDWTTQTTNGVAYSTTEQSFPLHDGSTGCPSTGVAGFRWLSGANSSCQLATAAGGSYVVEPAAPPFPACGDAVDDLAASGRPVLIPVFDPATPTGTYTVHGFAAFVVTRLDACPSPGVGTCVYGYFTQAVLPGTGGIGGPDLGARIVALVG